MANEASIEAKEEESVWQSGDCQSKASKKSGEGLSCLCFEEKCMRWMESKCYTCICGASHMQHVDRLGEHLYLLPNLIDGHQNVCGAEGRWGIGTCLTLSS